MTRLSLILPIALSGFFITSLQAAPTQSTLSWHNWNSTLHCPAVPFFTPNSPKDIPQTGGPYLIVGSGHSWNEKSCRFKGIISTKNFTKPPRLFKKGNDIIVETGAGISLNDLLIFLEKNGRSLETFPNVPHVTIGGAIATATHGTCFQQGTLSDSVVNVKVTPFINKKINLAAYAANIGKLGVVTEVQLRTVPSQILQRQVDVVTTDLFFQQWEVLQKENTRFQAWYDVDSNNVMLLRYKPPGNSFTVYPNVKPTGYLAKQAIDIPSHVKGTVAQLMIVFNPPKTPYIEGEYILKNSKAVAAIKGLQQFLLKNHIKMIRSILVRFGGKDKLAWLSPANWTESVVFLNIDLPKDHEKDMEKIEKFLIENYEARFHWGKWYSHDFKLMHKAYGKHLDQFIQYQAPELKKLYGPLY